MAKYDIAQICLNGHVANIYTMMMPERGCEFCETCGEKTITACTGCRHEIQGAYQGAFQSEDNFAAPNFCRSCGKPYPWIERKLQAAKELIEPEQTLTANERTAFEADINDITRDVPRTQAAAIRIKGFLVKVPGAVGSALRDIVVDIASEAAKKTIFGP